MNCRPGDLAVIVKALRPKESHYIGKIVRCVSMHVIFEFPCWVVDPPVPGYAGICDLVLHPIRDPGDDAKDEMLRPLPQSVEAYL